MKTIGFVSEKGGTGKSTSLILVSRATAEQVCELCEQEASVDLAEGRGQELSSEADIKLTNRVLVIDLDTLGSTTMHFLPDDLREQDPYGKKHVAAAMTDERDDNLRDYIIASSYIGIDLLRCSDSIRRIAFTQNLIRNKIRVSKLEDFYDFIFIDTPATYNPLHISALTAVNTIVTPVNPSLFDYSASEHLKTWINQDISEDADWHFFFTRMKPENDGQSEYIRMFKQRFGEERFYSSMIPDSIKVKNTIDRKYAISHARIFMDFRAAVCGLASEMTGITVDPKECF